MPFSAGLVSHSFFFLADPIGEVQGETRGEYMGPVAAFESRVLVLLETNIA